MERRPPDVGRGSWPLGSVGLLLVNLIVFLVLLRGGGSENQLVLLKWGAKSNDLIWEGEWWRFVTPVFIHMGWVHLIGNGVVLFFFGRLLETLVGTVRFLSIYVIAGVCGVIAGFCFHDQLSAGASGAIFGLFGGLLAFVELNRSACTTLRSRDLIGFCVWVGFLLLLGFQHRNIDNWAHVGDWPAASWEVDLPRARHVVPRPRLRWAAGFFW